MNRRGYTVFEALVAMSIFAVGILALSQSYAGIKRAQAKARLQELATQCAKDRMEEILYSYRFADITEANFPDEDFGAVDEGAPMYEAFSRSVSIRDSLDVHGDGVLKEVTVTVNWHCPEGVRDLVLNSVIARYKDLKP